MKEKTKLPAPPPLPAEHLSLTEALHNFERLTPQAQMQLAYEVALTRGTELCLAYDNLLSVSAGFRTRRSRTGGAPEVHREPCVGFIVKRKWPTAGRPGHPQALPKHLLAFADLEGLHLLCAVPTDVRSKRAYGRPVPHDGGDKAPPFGILVGRANSSNFSSGVVTCVIRRPDAGDRVFMMSCRHVLSRTDLELDTGLVDLPVVLGSPARTPLARTLGARGSLAGGHESGFDAQLAALDDQADGPAFAMGDIAFDEPNSFIHQLGNVPFSYVIATGRADVNGRRLLIGVQHVDAIMNFEIPYPQADGSQVTVMHDLVLHGTPTVPLIPGDSGSPVISTARGETLVGMYIAGSPGNAYILPAWQLMTPANFSMVGETAWTLG